MGTKINIILYSVRLQTSNWACRLMRNVSPEGIAQGSPGLFSHRFLYSWTSFWGLRIHFADPEAPDDLVCWVCDCLRVLLQYFSFTWFGFCHVKLLKDNLMLLLKSALHLIVQKYFEDNMTRGSVSSRKAVIRREKPWQHSAELPS